MKSILVGFFLLQLLSAEVKAFTLSGSSNLRGWRNSNVSLQVNSSNCPANLDIVSISKEAMNVWNKVPTSSLKLSYAGATTSTTYGSPIVVYCETNFQSVTGADQDYVIGVGGFTASGNYITGAVIYLNVSAGNANISNATSKELVEVMAHEMGHTLGLGHSEKQSALMYYSASGTYPPILSQDDIDGISYLYPSNESSGNGVAGCGVVKDGPPPSSGHLFFGLFLILLPLSLVFCLQQKGLRLPLG